MFSSLRSRIVSLFLLSFFVSASALLYSLAQFETIGNGLYVLNACYLPISDEATKLDIIVFQLQREQDQVIQSQQSSKLFLNGEFYIKELNDGLKRTRKIIELSQQVNFPNPPSGLNNLLNKTLQAQSQLNSYQRTWESWQRPEKGTPSTTPKLEKEKIRLVLAIRQLASTISSEIIIVSQQTEQSRKDAQYWSGLLAIFATLFWTALVMVTLRTLKPIEHITKQVTRLRKGERVEVMSGRLVSEIKVLSEEFNSMADAVAERDQRLSERAQALDILSQRLQQAIDSIRIGFFVIEDGKISMLNRAAKEMWALKIQDPKPDWLPEIPEGELEHSQRIIQLDSAVFGDSGIIIVTEDITQRVKVSEELNRSQRLATIGNMLAQVTHEVRNPLNAMSLTVEMLADEPLSSLGKEMLDILSTEIINLEETTARYLDLSRQKAPYIEFQDPKPIVQALIQIEEADRQLDFSLKGTSSSCYLDQDSFRRSLRNLFRNAKEAEATQVEIAFQDQGDVLLIFISDNGIGLEEHSEQSLFEPFFTTKAAGTGLGLSICRQELDGFGAKLELNSRESQSQGASFRLTIPKIETSI